MLTVPLWVMGAYPQNYPFIEDARTIRLNRDGALIRIFRPLQTGQSVLVVNLATQRDAEFRVVGPVAPFTELGGEYGIECLKPGENIWEIKFPAPSKAQLAAAKAVLECRGCRTVELKHLSLIEAEVLGTAGLISKPCVKCRVKRSWGHLEKRLAMGIPPEEAKAILGRRGKQAGADRRGEPRLALQVPVLVRDFNGEAEITLTENASKGGFCFTSQKDYQLGEGVMARCPYSTKSPDPEIRARIVRRDTIEGAQYKIYGVHFEVSFR
jgi:hypothetical protein